MKISLPFEQRFYRCEQGAKVRLLAQSFDSRLPGLLLELPRGVNRNHQNWGVGMLLQELAPGFKTIHLGHYEIHYRKIRGVFRPLLESAATVFGFTDNYPVVLLFEHTSQLGADHGVIID
jgi:hypothetical protein